jgi:hypothetical protein
MRGRIRAPHDTLFFAVAKNRTIRDAQRGPGRAPVAGAPLDQLWSEVRGVSATVSEPTSSQLDHDYQRAAASGTSPKSIGFVGVFRRNISRVMVIFLE